MNNEKHYNYNNENLEVPCRAEGCERGSCAMGYCIKHYQRLHRWGFVEDKPTPELCKNGHVLKADNILPPNKNGRKCRACDNAARKRYYMKHREVLIRYGTETTRQRRNRQKALNEVKKEE